MKTRYTFLFSFILFGTATRSQNISYTPEMAMGNRSLFYQHGLSKNINPKLRFSNLTIYDADYQNEKNNIYFIRNTVSFLLDKHISLNAALGIKNPGAFATVAFQYFLKTPVFHFAYSAGITYRADFTFEQSLFLEYTPRLFGKSQFYFRAQAIANHNLEQYQRGIQQLRIGIKQDRVQYGLALNLDQFDNGFRKLGNAGLFIRYHF